MKNEIRKILIAYLGKEISENDTFEDLVDELEALK